MVQKKTVIIKYCPTTDMLANYLTKPLSRPTLNQLKKASSLIKHHSANSMT